MMIRAFVIALVCSFAVVGPSAAQDASKQAKNQKATKEMIFESMSKEDRATVAKNLQNLLEESVGRAESMIKEDGGVTPYAYLGNHEGEGNFVAFDPEQKAPANTAAKVVQRSVMKAALSGTAVASILYVSTPAPTNVDIKTRQKIQESLPVGVTFDDLRFLMIEMQHVAGLGLLQIVPYWKKEGEWVIGPSQQKQIDPSLHAFLMSKYQEAAKRQQKKQSGSQQSAE